MEDPDKDQVFLQPIQAILSMSLNKGGSSEPEQEDPEMETTESRGPLTLTNIEFRMQQLNNRRLLLQEIQRCTKKEEQNGEKVTQRGEVIDEMHELKSILKEIEELQVKKEELENNTEHKEYTNGDFQEQCSFYKQIPRGGIYMLPPPLPIQEVPAADQSHSDPIVPVEILGPTAAVTKCPSCAEVITTETHNTRGAAMWIMCFLCSIMGCVAGCCLIPFYMKRLRNTHHRCPQCQAHINTHHPL